MVGRTVYISPLQADSMLNQANLFKKLLQECGYEGVFKSTITVEDLDKDDVAGAIWFQLASINFIGDAIVPYILGRKPKVLYVTCEGVLTKGNVVHSNIKRCEFVAVSNFVKECLQSVGLKVRKVVHHAIDWKLCGQVHEKNLIQRRQIQQYAKDRVKFIVVARDDPRKNLKGLAEAMKILNKKGYEKDYVVFLISDESAKQKFHGINNAVFIKSFGGSAHEFVLGYIACCDYLIHPAYSEGFGLPVLEANAVGIPAIHCFPPNTLVATADGFKPIENIKIGDLVLTHKGRFRKVTKVYRRYYKGKLIGVKPKAINRTIWMTPEHPVLATVKSKKANAKKTLWNGSKDKWLRLCSKKTMRWVEAKDLTYRDVLVVPRVKDSEVVIDVTKYVSDYVKVGDKLYAKGSNQFGVNFIKPRAYELPATINPSDEWLRFFGYYLAEGCKCKTDVQLCLSMKDKAIIGDIVKQFEHARVKIRSSNDVRVFIAGRLLSDFLTNLFGHGARNKQIPLFLLQLPKERLRHLFKALILGDGCVSTYKEKYKAIRYTTVSDKLALSLFLLSVKLGHPMTITWDYKGRRGHQLSCSTYNTEFEDGYKGRREYVLDEDYLYLPIKEITEKEYEGYVYNLEVEEDNSYVVEGIVVHNCDFPPLNEFTSPDFNFMFNYIDKQAVKCNIYQYWLFHIFTPDMLAEMISYAIDVYKNSKDEYQEYCTKAREHTKNWDYHVKYVELMKELNLVIPRDLIDYIKHGLEWITEIR